MGGRGATWVVILNKSISSSKKQVIESYLRNQLAHLKYWIPTALEALLAERVSIIAVGFDVGSTLGSTIDDGTVLVVLDTDGGSVLGSALGSGSALRSALGSTLGILVGSDVGSALGTH